MAINEFTSASIDVVAFKKMKLTEAFDHFFLHGTLDTLAYVTFLSLMQYYPFFVFCTRSRPLMPNSKLTFIKS